MYDFTNRRLPQEGGAGSFKRVLGGARPVLVKPIFVPEIEQTMPDHRRGLTVEHQDHEHVPIVGIHENVLKPACGVPVHPLDAPCCTIETLEVADRNGVEVRPEVEGWRLVPARPKHPHAERCTVLGFRDPPRFVAPPNEMRLSCGAS